MAKATRPWRYSEAMTAIEALQTAVAKLAAHSHLAGPSMVRLRVPLLNMADTESNLLLQAMDEVKDEELVALRVALLLRYVVLVVSSRLSELGTNADEATRDAMRPDLDAVERALEQLEKCAHKALHFSPSPAASERNAEAERLLGEATIDVARGARWHEIGPRVEGAVTAIQSRAVPQDGRSRIRNAALLLRLNELSEQSLER